MGQSSEITVDGLEPQATVSLSMVGVGSHLTIWRLPARPQKATNSSGPKGLIRMIGVGIWRFGDLSGGGVGEPTLAQLYGIGAMQLHA